MKKAFTVFMALFLVSIFVRAQKIETVNGVRVVHNEKGGKWGANPEVKLELIRTMGGLEAEENLSFNNPNDIVRDSAGNYYILDSGNNRIQKLDSHLCPFELSPAVSILLVKCQRPLTFHRPDSAFRAGAFPVFSGRRGPIGGDGPFLEAILPPCRLSEN
jgi:hypothetical protein